MLAIATKMLGSHIAVRYGHKPMFLIPGRWADGTTPTKRASKGYIAEGADPNDPRLIVHRVEFLGEGQQWVAIGDHDTAETQYKYLDPKLSPLTTTHDQLEPFTLPLIERVIDEYEWAAEQEFDLIEYGKPERQKR